MSADHMIAGDALDGTNETGTAPGAGIIPKGIVVETHMGEGRGRDISGRPATAAKATGEGAITLAPETKAVTLITTNSKDNSVVFTQIAGQTNIYPANTSPEQTTFGNPPDMLTPGSTRGFTVPTDLPSRAVPTVALDADQAPNTQGQMNAQADLQAQVVNNMYGNGMGEPASALAPDNLTSVDASFPTNDAPADATSVDNFGGTESSGAAEW